MRKSIFIFIALFAVQASILAKTDPTPSEDKAKDKDIFKHLGVGLGIGTTGITVDVSSNCTPFLGIRAGVDIIPKFKFPKTFYMDVDEGTGHAKQVYREHNGMADNPAYLEHVKTQPKLGQTTGHFLFDIFPGKKTKFRATVGFYFTGKDAFVKFNNKTPGWFQDVYDFNNSLPSHTNPGVSYADVDHTGVGLIGIQLNNGTCIGPDQQGNMRGEMRVNKFRPYIGFGVGRAVPQKRVGVMFDAGVQFWGKPKTFIQGTQVKKGDTDALDTYFKYANKFVIYPCISLRIVGRIL